MKKVLCILIVSFLFLCSCSHEGQPLQSQSDSVSNDYVFSKNENGNLINDSGEEYVHLANEGILFYLGDLEFEGSVEGEEKTSQHLGHSYQTGMFAIKGDKSNNILIRRTPNNEWLSIYRKSSLPTFDFTVDNCVRFELVSGIGHTENDAIHTTCGDGIIEPSKIEKFLSDVRSQKGPREAGLYDFVKKPDGSLENCHVCAVIYGFFTEEPNVVVRMNITSYNDFAYSVSLEGKEYVLPEEWVREFKINQ